MLVVFLTRLSTQRPKIHKQKLLTVNRSTTLLKKLTTQKPVDIEAGDMAAAYIEVDARNYHNQSYQRDNDSVLERSGHSSGFKEL